MQTVKSIFKWGLTIILREILILSSGLFFSFHKERTIWPFGRCRWALRKNLGFHSGFNMPGKFWAKYEDTAIASLSQTYWAYLSQAPGRIYPWPKLMDTRGNPCSTSKCSSITWFRGLSHSAACTSPRLYILFHPFSSFLPNLILIYLLEPVYTIKV